MAGTKPHFLAWESRPTQPDTARAALDEALAAGPAGFAQLGALNLWLVGQVQDPRDVYPGPEGLRPLPYLANIVAAVLAEVRPGFSTHSPYFHLAEKFPKPAPPRQPQPGLPPDQAAQLAQAVLDEVNDPARFTTHGHRDYRLQTRLVELWEQGVPPDSLARLADAVSEPGLSQKEHRRLPETRAQAAQALLRTGDLARAGPLISAALAEINPREHGEALLNLARCARTYVQIGRPDQARQLLRYLIEQRGQVPADRRPRLLREIADTLAYLDDAVAARDLAYGLSVSAQLGVEGILLLAAVYAGRAPDPAPLLAVLDRTGVIEPAKSRAHDQLCALETLLAVGEYQPAWRALKFVQESLLATPLWGKYEYRTHNTANVLWPHCVEHAAPIYAFALALLTAARDSRDVWRVVHTLCALSWLTRAWCGDEGLRSLGAFAQAWQETAK